MKLFLDDSESREQLHPFTYTRHVAEIRIGILTIKEKWEKLTGKPVITSNGNSQQTITIAANIIPTLKNFNDIINAAKNKTVIKENKDIKILKYPWQIFQYNDWALRQDF